MRAANTAELRAAMTHRLTPRDRWLLAMLHEHRVLTTHQIQAVAFTSGRVARRRLLELYEWAMIDRFRPRTCDGAGEPPWHWTLAPAGAQMLAAEYGLVPPQIGYRPDRARAIAGHQALAHTVEVAQVFLGLIEHAHHVRGAALTRWWSEGRCTRLFGDLARPDAYGRWRVETRPLPVEVEFFLELDRSTERPAHRFARRLEDYARLAQATGIATPILVWTRTLAREAGVRRALHTSWTQLDDPAAVPVATASTEGLHQRPDPYSIQWQAAGPTAPARPTARPCAADPVWAPLDLPERHARRHRLHELAAFWRLAPISETTESPGDTGSPDAADAFAAVDSADAGILSRPGTRGSNRYVELPAPDPMPPRPPQRPQQPSPGRERSRW